MADDGEELDWGGEEDEHYGELTFVVVSHVIGGNSSLKTL